MIRTVIKHHGVPTSIVSDRDPSFTGHFLQAPIISLWMFGIKLMISTAFHFQTNGLKERTNQTIKHMHMAVRSKTIGMIIWILRIYLQQLKASFYGAQSILSKLWTEISYTYTDGTTQWWSIFSIISNDFHQENEFGIS